jgi:serine/threonine protein kinase
MFKDLVIGQGKYGTVFFGIDAKKARLVAIKVSNEEKRNIFLSVEI